MDLGIYGLKLPFDNPDETLVDVLRLKTLKTFSIFSPVIEIESHDLGRMETVGKEDYTRTIYIIPRKYSDRQIIYVRNVLPRNKLAGNGYIAPVFDGSIGTFLDLAMTQANADLVSIAAPPITFKFVAPNQLWVYNFATNYGDVEIEIGYSHSNNFTTIPETSYESFYDLALIDIKRFLFNAMKHYKEINTAYGTISLRIDDWENAESERKDLIERWRDVYHLETQDQFMVI